MTLQQFNSQRSCVKCCGDDIHAAFHEKGWIGYDSACWAKKCDEHICRYCRRCGYRWMEACVDDYTVQP